MIHLTQHLTEIIFLLLHSIYSTFPDNQHLYLFYRKHFPGLFDLSPYFSEILLSKTQHYFSGHMHTCILDVDARNSHERILPCYTWQATYPDGPANSSHFYDIDNLSQKSFLRSHNSGVVSLLRIFAIFWLLFSGDLISAIS